MTLILKSLVVAGAASAVLLATNLPTAGTVQLCDGQTKLELDTLPDTPEGGMAVATALMAEWQAKNPGQVWALGTPQDPATR